MGNKKKVAVYGSLRKGEYNYERFVDYFKGGLEYLRTTVVRGYDLYDLGAYPGIRVSSDLSKELVVDIMECSDDCFKHIEAMEHGAGYNSVSITVGADECTIYVYNYPATNLVESGDWSKYLSHEQEIEN